MTRWISYKIDNNDEMLDADQIVWFARHEAGTIVRLAGGDHIATLPLGFEELKQILAPAPAAPPETVPPESVEQAKQAAAFAMPTVTFDRADGFGKATINVRTVAIVAPNNNSYHSQPSTNITTQVPGGYCNTIAVIGHDFDVADQLKAAGWQHHTIDKFGIKRETTKPDGTPQWGEIERTAREARAKECETIRDLLVDGDWIVEGSTSWFWLTERAASIRAGKA